MITLFGVVGVLYEKDFLYRIDDGFASRYACFGD